jgi:hypothetical protein
MSSVLELAPSLQASQMSQACIVAVSEGASVTVRLLETAQVVECQVLQTGAIGLTLAVGDTVLVWLQDGASNRGVLLGRTGPYAPPAPPVVAPEAFAARPESLVLEAQGEIVLRNGQSKIRMGADGEIEIVCASFTTRTHRLLRLLAPMIKLN